jgi:ferredoxin
MRILLLFSILTINIFNLSASSLIPDGPTQELSESILEYKDNYIPKVFKPIPEYMYYIDFSVMLILLFAGVYMVLKLKSQKAITILSIFCFVYLGFIRGGCICPVGATSNVVMGIVNPENVGLLTSLLFLVPLIVALFLGRVFCSSACPLGAVQQLGKKKKKYLRLPSKLNFALKVIPIGVLVATIYFSITGELYFICELDPYKAIFFTGQSWFEQFWGFITNQPKEIKFLFAGNLVLGIYLSAILILGIWVPRPFCRFICPYGVILGFLSIFSFKTRKINKDCIQCGLCVKSCPTQAIKVDRKTQYSHISNYDCIQCNACTDVCRKESIEIS